MLVIASTLLVLTPMPQAAKATPSGRSSGAQIVSGARQRSARTSRVIAIVRTRTPMLEAAATAGISGVKVSVSTPQLWVSFERLACFKVVF